MARPVIRVERLWKQYAVPKLGHARETFREMLAGAVSRRSHCEEELFWALRDVSFEVSEGEVVGVIGRNGAGKSTLLKVLSRITDPTKGTVTLQGRVASLLEVGTGFHPELSGRENIFLNGAILGLKRMEIQRRFDEIVSFAEVDQFLEMPVKHYSSGMYVRLAFAVAAHLDPEILIIDEVLAVGDIEFQRKCLGRMDEIAKARGRTVLFVSHNLQAIQSLTQRCVVLQDGWCASIAPTSQAIRDYLRSGGASAPEWSGLPSAQEPRIVGVTVVTNKASGLQEHGLPMEVRFRLDVPLTWSRGCLSFQIFNEFDVPVTHCWTFDRPLGVVRQPGTHTLICRLPKVRLYMGSYYLKVFLSEEQNGPMYQRIEKACPFEVAMVGDRSEWSWREGAALYLEEMSWTVQ